MEDMKTIGCQSEHREACYFGVPLKGERRRSGL